MIGNKIIVAGITLATFVAFFGEAGRVSAHHSYSSNYDSSKPQTVTGVIQEVSYASPHITMRLATLGSSKQTWVVDLPPPARAERRGLTQSFLKVGATATVEGWPARDGDNELGAVRITIGDRAVQLH